MRKNRAERRDVIADPIYNSKLVTRLINRVMLDGKKGTAQTIIYNAFSLIAERSGKDPMEVFEEAMNNVMQTNSQTLQKSIASVGKAVG